MRYTEVLNAEQMIVMSNGVLAFLCLILIVFIIIIFCGYLSGVFSELYIEKKYKKSEYQKGYEIGYENGYKDGLTHANLLMGEFMKEHQEKIDRLLFSEEDEL